MFGGREDERTTIEYTHLTIYHANDRHIVEQYQFRNHPSLAEVPLTDPLLPRSWTILPELYQQFNISLWIPGVFTSSSSRSPLLEFFSIPSSDTDKISGVMLVMSFNCLYLFHSY